MNDPRSEFSALIDSIPRPSPAVRERLAARLETLIEAERAGSQPSRRRQPRPWTRRVMVVAVAAVILAVFFVPLPHVSLFNRLVSPAKKSTTTSVPVTLPKRVESPPNSTPNPTGALDSSLSAVSCTSATACTAVASYNNSTGAGVTLAEAWNGKTWTIEPTPNPNGATESSLTGVSCASATACTAVGYDNSPGYDVTLAEAWNGKTWVVEPTPNAPNGGQPSSLAGVSCTSATACTAVGGYTNSPDDLTLAEAWNGKKWTIVPTPNPNGATGSSLTAVSCASAIACTAVGQYYDSAGRQVALAEAWNGGKWTIAPPLIPNGATRISLSCASATACTAVGGYNNRTLAEAWNGKTWVIEPTPNPTGTSLGSLSEVSCASATACTAIGYYQHNEFSDQMTLVEAWNGKTWAIKRSPNPSSLSGLSCTSATACTAVGSLSNRTLAEAWNGKTWVIEPTPNPTGALESNLSVVSCTSATSCTAVGGGPRGTLAEAWNGKTWVTEPTPNPGGGSLSGVSCASATACTAVGGYDSGTLAEAWNGKTWVIEPTPKLPGAKFVTLSAVSCTSATACTAVGAYHHRTLAEAWNGKTWAIEPTPNPLGGAYSYLDGVSCTSAATCTAVGDYRNSVNVNTGHTLAEAWNGKTWAIEPTPNPLGGVYSDLDGVSCTSATACTAAGGYDRGTLVEAWNGKRWAIESTPSLSGGRDVSLFAVSCTSATACTAVGTLHGFTLAEVWNGKRWVIEPTPNPPGRLYSSVYGLSCTSATACTAVGYDGFLSIAEVWNGKTWVIY